jgi:hypothetical protein
VPRGLEPCFSLRLLSLLPIISFHMISLSPCRAHWLRLSRVVLLPWKIDDFVDEVGGKNGTADYADCTDFLGLVVSVLTGRNR